MKKVFLLLAFTGMVSAASATTVLALTKGTVITLCGDDKKQDGKKKCEKKSCCKKSAEASSGCAAAKNDKTAMKAGAKENSGTAEVKEKQVVATTPAPEPAK